MTPFILSGFTVALFDAPKTGNPTSSRGDAALASLRCESVATQLLQYLPSWPRELMQLDHHILERPQEPVHVSFADIQGRQDFYDGHGMTSHLGKD